MSSLRIGITKGVEFVVDQHDTLSIERQDTIGQLPTNVRVGFMTNHLIDQMIENLNRLRPHAK
jgi:hypothetical protein